MIVVVTLMKVIVILIKMIVILIKMFLPVPMLMFAGLLRSQLTVWSLRKTETLPLVRPTNTLPQW